jgi:hypothetical protein
MCLHSERAPADGGAVTRIILWALLVVGWADLHLWLDATRTAGWPLALLVPGAAATYLVGRRALPARTHGALRFATVLLGLLLLGLSLFDVPDRYLQHRLRLWASGARSATVAEALADPPWWVELTDGELSAGAACDDVPCPVPILGAGRRAGIWLCDGDVPDGPRPLFGTLAPPDGRSAAAVARAAAARGLETPNPLCFRWSYVNRATFEAMAKDKADRPLRIIHAVLLLGLYFVVTARGAQRSWGSGS